jgi:flagellar protein FlaJ
LIKPLSKKIIEFIERIKQSGKLRSFYSIMIIHLYSLSTVTSYPRDVINIAGNSKYALGDLTTIFKRISILVDRWNYTIYKAINLVSSTIREDNFKKFFQRLSYSLNTGIDLENFMKIEYEKLLEAIEAEFDRAIERIKRYIEAYSALLTSAAFLSVSILLVSTIYGIETEKMLIYSILMITISLASVIFLMAKTLPPDPILHSEEIRPASLKLIEKINSLIFIPCTAILIFLFISLNKNINGEQTVTSNLTPIPLPLITAGIPLLLIGRIGRKWVKQVEKIDENYPSFVKSLGDAILVTNSLKESSKILEINDYGELNKLIKRLRRRLEAGFEQNKSLNVLGLESLSSLVLKTIRIVADSIFYGARSEVYTKSIYDYITRHLIDRKKRRQTAGTLRGLAIPLQATLVTVAALIATLTKILYRFNLLIQDWFPVIAAVSPSQVSTYFYIIILVVASSSSIALYIVEGDSKFTLTYSHGLLLTLSGAVYYLVSLGSETLFHLFIKFEEEIEEIVGGF